MEHHGMTKMQHHGMITINVAQDFSNTPGGRYIQDGKHSGQAFRQECLCPAFDLYVGPVQVTLDGTEGYPASFLEEAFGGLARIYGAYRCKKWLSFISEEEPGLIDEIWGYIDGCRDTKDAQPPEEKDDASLIWGQLPFHVRCFNPPVGSPDGVYCWVPADEERDGTFTVAALHQPVPVSAKNDEVLGLGSQKYVCARIQKYQVDGIRVEFSSREVVQVVCTLDPWWDESGQLAPDCYVIVGHRGENGLRFPVGGAIFGTEFDAREVLLAELQSQRKIDESSSSDEPSATLELRPVLFGAPLEIRQPIGPRKYARDVALYALEQGRQVCEVGGVSWIHMDKDNRLVSIAGHPVGLPSGLLDSKSLWRIHPDPCESSEAVVETSEEE